MKSVAVIGGHGPETTTDFFRSRIPMPKVEQLAAAVNVLILSIVEETVS